MPLSLALIPDVDLIAELRRRGLATVIVMAKQDEVTGVEGAKVGLFLTGPVRTCLGLAALALGKAKTNARKAGFAEPDIVDIIDAGEQESGRV